MSILDKLFKNDRDVFGVDGSGMVPLENGFFLRVRIDEPEGFDGAVIHADLYNERGCRVSCVQRFKMIVEPLRTREKLSRWGKRNKSSRAVDELKKMALGFIYGQEFEVRNTISLITAIVR